jgi:hypothetical protein
MCTVHRFRTQVESIIYISNFPKKEKYKNSFRIFWVFQPKFCSTKTHGFERSLRKHAATDLNIWIFVNKKISSTRSRGRSKTFSTTKQIFFIFIFSPTQFRIKFIIPINNCQNWQFSSFFSLFTRVSLTETR